MYWEVSNYGFFKKSFLLAVCLLLAGCEIEGSRIREATNLCSSSGGIEWAAFYHRAVVRCANGEKFDLEVK